MALVMASSLTTPPSCQNPPGQFRSNTSPDSKHSRQRSTQDKPREGSVLDDRGFLSETTPRWVPPTKDPYGVSWSRNICSFPLHLDARDVIKEQEGAQQGSGIWVFASQGSSALRSTRLCRAIIPALTASLT